MNPTYCPVRETHPLRFSSQLLRISLLFLIMMWIGSAASRADLLPGGQEIVNI